MIYGLCGLENESHLAEFLRGSRTGNLGELSREQIKEVDKSQREVIRKEDDLSFLMASLQEDMVDQPFAAVGREWMVDFHLSRDVEKELDAHGEKLASILEEADKLRLNTVKEIINILSHQFRH